MLIIFFSGAGRTVNCKPIAIYSEEAKKNKYQRFERVKETTASVFFRSIFRASQLAVVAPLNLAKCGHNKIGLVTATTSHVTLGAHVANGQ